MCSEAPNAKLRLARPSTAILVPALRGRGVASRPTGSRMLRIGPLSRSDGRPGARELERVNAVIDGVCAFGRNAFLAKMDREVCRSSSRHFDEWLFARSRHRGQP